jgi:glyoxylase-like metal-dependent hydrolase (beta-lactamase superfamily II)/rhodanese-related sulfurtransferase
LQKGLALAIVLGGAGILRIGFIEGIAMLIFRQLQDLKSSTFTYLLADSVTREAVLIDPVFEQARRDSALLRELELRLICTLDTHVHADHVTGAWLLKQSDGSRIAISANSGASGIDLPLQHGDQVHFGSRHLHAHATPGHTNGCMTFVLDDSSMAFTGDALLIRGAGRTDFQQGDAHVLFRSIKEQIFTLPDDCLIFPAHDYRGLTCSSVAEEKLFNPRIGAKRSEHDFVGYMENLGLPHPKQIDVAVPANLRCGHTAELNQGAGDWAPLRFTYAGINEIEPEWVAEHSLELQIVDVRDEDEYTGVLGHIPGATLIPLAHLHERLDALRKERPIVTVCRSGARSAQAVTILDKAGFAQVANLAGGMINWNNQRLTVES